MPFEVMLADGFLVSDDRGRFDVDAIHRFLSEESYWSRGRSRAVTEGTIANSLCIGVYAPHGAQAGFGRLVTDLTTMAHLSDVFVLPAHRGRGLGKALVGALLSHPAVRGVRRWSLSTQDAHAMYAAFGFGEVLHPERQMMRMLPALEPQDP